MFYKFYQKHIFPHLLNQVMQTPSLMDLRRELLLGVSGEVLKWLWHRFKFTFLSRCRYCICLGTQCSNFQLAQERIDAAPFMVEQITASAEQLPFANDQLKHVVSTWTLCSIPDLEQSLREIYRVLQPGGTLHLVEHVLNRQNLNIQRLQHLLTPIQKKVADGCHLNRDIEIALLETGFGIG